MDLFERMRTAPPKWTPVDDLLPDKWSEKSFYCQIRDLPDIKFKVLLSNGIQYYSHFREGKWLITQRNPRFIVTHWVQPVLIA